MSVLIKVFIVNSLPANANRNCKMQKNKAVQKRKNPRYLSQYCVLNHTVTLLHILSKRLSCFSWQRFGSAAAETIQTPSTERKLKNGKEGDFVVFF